MIDPTTTGRTPRSTDRAVDPKGAPGGAARPSVVSGPLRPYRPTADRPFDLAKVGHLTRRAGLGASLAERERLRRLGPAAAVRAVTGSAKPGELDAALPDVLAMNDLRSLQAFRTWRLLVGEHRLAERMSLFWHDHFATSHSKVRNVRMMGRQQQLFDSLGLGRFDDLLLAICRDPAMIRWLDNETNLAGKANENFARELLELFSLGPGHYTEADVQQAARAFTGWHLRDERFVFRRFHHDAGTKRLFGKSGRFTGEDVVAMIVTRPASARFLAVKLLRQFVHPEPTPAEIRALAEVYEAEARDVGATLRVLLASELFFSDRAYRSLIKSPADFVVGLVRDLGVRAAPKPLAAAMARMGQELLVPPNVAGWRGGREWITPATWLLRTNFVAGLFRKNYKVRPAADALLGRGSAVERTDRVLQTLVDGAVDAASRDAIFELARSGATGAELIHAVQCLPEGQML